MQHASVWYNFRMQTLRQCVLQAKKEKKAIGHFNFSNIEGLYAIARAARTLHVPVIVGLSEGEEEAIGTAKAALKSSSLTAWTRRT